MQVSFYGLKADAAMAANVFEVAYNIVLDKGLNTYGNKGKSKSIMDYRCISQPPQSHRTVIASVM
jgi:hypothetical protein